MSQILKVFLNQNYINKYFHFNQYSCFQYVKNIPNRKNFKMSINYKLMLQNTKQTLNNIQLVQTITDELIVIQRPPVSSSEIACAHIIVEALQKAVYQSIPCPAQPLPFTVNIPGAQQQNDPEFTFILNQTNDQIKTFETTEVTKKFVFEVDKECEPQNSQTATAKVANATQGTGSYQAKQQNRPPSANIVRVLNKELQQQEAAKQTSKLDSKTLKNERIKMMQEALAIESKQGRKMDALPDGMRFVVADSGKIVGIGPTNPKPINEAIKNEFRIHRENDDKKKGKKGAKEEEEVVDESIIFDETNKKYLESLFGKVKPEDMLKKNQPPKRK